MKVAPLLALALVSASSALAQAPSRPLEVTVNPSGVERPEEAARRRQEQLEERMRRNDFLFRSICRTCSSSDKFESSAPFNPQEALRGVIGPR